MASLRSEAIKLLTTRGLYGLIAGAAAIVVLGTVSTMMSENPSEIGGSLHEQTFYTLASINAGLFGLVLGIRSFTDEFRHGTVALTILATGNRVRVALAKAAVAALAALALGVVVVAAMAAVAVALGSLRGGEFAVSGSDLGPSAGMVAAIAVWAVLGVGVGVIVRHQVAAIVGGLIWVLIIENVGSGLLGDAGRMLPGQAGHALARATQAGELIPAPLAAAVFIAYAILIWLVGAITLLRRDVL
jgi:ABC-2 type transport system permease protein